MTITFTKDVTVFLDLKDWGWDLHIKAGTYPSNAIPALKDPHQEEYKGVMVTKQDTYTGEIILADVINNVLEIRFNLDHHPIFGGLSMIKGYSVDMVTSIITV